MVKVLIGPPLGTPSTIKRVWGGCASRIISRITPTRAIRIIRWGANALRRVDGTFPIGVVIGGRVVGVIGVPMWNRTILRKVVA